jgi:hypothetical protein
MKLDVYMYNLNNNTNEKNNKLTFYIDTYEILNNYNIQIYNNDKYIYDLLMVDKTLIHII